MSEPEASPPQRQLLLVQTGDAGACGLGWFRNAERERLGRFSRPLYRDLPMGALVRADVPLADGVALATTLASGKQTVLTKLGTPSTTSTFERDNVWYYISQVTEKYTYNRPQVTQRTVTEITFNDTGQVAEVRTLGLEDGQQRDVVILRCATRAEVGELEEKILQTQKRADALVERIFVANHRTGSASIAPFSVGPMIAQALVPPCPQRRGCAQSAAAPVAAR